MLEHEFGVKSRRGEFVWEPRVGLGALPVTHPRDTRNSRIRGLEIPQERLEELGVFSLSQQLCWIKGEHRDQLLPHSQTGEEQGGASAALLGWEKLGLEWPRAITTFHKVLERGDNAT